MTICGVEKCPFYIKGICREKFTIIDENGACKQIWRRGQQKLDAFNPVKEEFMKEIKIVEIIETKPATKETETTTEEEECHQITIDEYLASLV